MEHGFIEISDLATFPSFTSDEPSINGDNVSVQSRAGTKEPAKKADIGESTSGVAASRNASPIKTSKKKAADEPPEVAATPIVADKSERKKKKKAAAAEAKAKDPVAIAGVEPLPVPPVAKEYETLASSTAAMGATHAADHAVSATPNLSRFNLSSEALGRHIQNLENTVSTQFSKTLGLEFDKLNRLFEDERRHWDAAGTARQDQVLRLVSDSLSDNVEKNLARIVSTSIQSDVIPHSP